MRILFLLLSLAGSAVPICRANDADISRLQFSSLRDPGAIWINPAHIADDKGPGLTIGASRLAEDYEETGATLHLPGNAALGYGFNRSPRSAYPGPEFRTHSFAIAKAGMGTGWFGPISMGLDIRVASGYEPYYGYWRVGDSSAPPDTHWSLRAFDFGLTWRGGIPGDRGSLQLGIFSMQTAEAWQDGNMFGTNIEWISPTDAWEVTTLLIPYHWGQGLRRRSGFGGSAGDAILGSVGFVWRPYAWIGSGIQLGDYQGTYLHFICEPVVGSGSLRLRVVLDMHPDSRGLDEVYAGLQLRLGFPSASRTRAPAP